MCYWAACKQRGRPQPLSEKCHRSAAMGGGDVACPAALEVSSAVQAHRHHDWCHLG